MTSSSENKKQNAKTPPDKPLIERGAMPIVILTVICALCVALLAWTAETTADARAAQRQWLEDKNKREIFPAADAFPAESLESAGEGITGKAVPNFSAEHPSVVQVFAAKQGDALAGVIIQSANKGYGGSVPVMVGFTVDGTIQGVVVDASTETAGLGQRTAEADFTDQFKGLSADDTFDGVETVSSATISSKSVVTSVRAACEAFKSIQGEEAN